jgi:ribosome-binding factor A
MIPKLSSSIKKSQKESMYSRELARLFLHVSMDEPTLRPLSVTRVKLSPDNSICTVFFYAPEGQEQFKDLLGLLIIYKGALRKALATNLHARHTPDLLFKYDDQFEKQKKVEDLMDKLKEEGQF